jgi:hypothetical protein
MSRLKSYFDSILIISLPERKDRRDALLGNLQSTGLATSADVEWVDACTGDHAGGPPPGWSAGKPAWGCLHSHLTCLDLAISRSSQSTLIMEDDAVFSRHAGHILRCFMEAVPDDWDQIYLGGNHAVQPIPTEHPWVWKAGGVTATHAYAVAASALDTVRERMADLHDYTYYRGWHCDTHLAKSHGEHRWQTYTPSWWLAAQEESVSDINRRLWPRRWFHSDHWRMSLPFIILENSNTLMPDEQQALYLPKIPAPTPVPELLDWLHQTASEALRLGRLPGLVSNANIPTSTLRALWPAGVRSHSECDLPALADYPFNGLFAHAMVPI